LTYFIYFAFILFCFCFVLSHFVLFYSIVFIRQQHLQINFAGNIWFYAKIRGVRIVQDNEQIAMQAMSRIIQDGSLLQTVREAGLPATSLSIVAIQEDNSTTLGSQLSAQLTNRPVVTSIGT